MSVILKASIVADVNDNLAISLSGTQLDNAIIKVLSDMSNRGLIIGVDSSQVLASGSLTLDFPTGYRSAISITLIDGSGNAKEPLRKLAGGHREYRELRENNDSTGLPYGFSEFNDKIYLMRPPDGAYTTLIEYRKNHAADADNIEFTTKFSNLMYAGATFWYAAKLNRQSSIVLWSPIYANLMREAVLNRREQPSIAI